MTGAYTVHLNMQQFLWDGIKRDRLVWVGDLHPEIMTINSVFGAQPIVPASLDLIRDATPLPAYMNGISSYSMWWILIQRDWYLYQGDLEYLREQAPYLKSLLALLMSKTSGGRERLDGWRFLDWSTEGKEGAVEAGLQAMMVLALDAGADLSDILEDRATAQACRKLVASLKRHVPDAKGNKQATALQALAGMLPARRAAEVLSAGGVQGFSTFYGYYILRAKALAGDYSGAMRDIREYWGGMLDLGATTFWEDFDIGWMENAGRIDELVPPGKKDVHASYGSHAFKKLRMSLAHGWASGPTSWLTQYVLGINVIEPGARAVRIAPHLGDLEFAEGTFPTPHGVIKVKHIKSADGEVVSDIHAPEGIRIVLEGARRRD